MQWHWLWHWSFKNFDFVRPLLTQRAFAFKRLYPPRQGRTGSSNRPWLYTSRQTGPVSGGVTIVTRRPLHCIQVQASLPTAKDLRASFPVLLPPSLSSFFDFVPRSLFPLPSYSSPVNRVRLKFHLARLDSTRHIRLCRASRASRDESVERDEPCSSNMADDERSCTSLVVFMLLHTQILFVSSNKIN